MVSIIVPEGTRESTLVTKGGVESTMMWVCGDTTVALPERGGRTREGGGGCGDRTREGVRGG